MALNVKSWLGISKAQSAAPASPSATKDVQIGSYGLMQYSGYVREEFQKELIGNRGVRVYREMRDNSPVVGALMFAIEMLIRNVDWHFEPVDAKSRDDVDAANFLTDCRQQMEHTWIDFIAEVLSMLTFGWANFEIVYKQLDDGRYGWARFVLLAQETLLRWEFDSETGALLGMWQLAPPHWKTTLIPAERSMLFRTTTHKNNPEGRSILRNAYRPWYFGKRIEEIEGIGIERDLAGLPTIYVPARITNPNANAAEKAQYDYIKKLIRNIRRDEQEGVVLPGDRDEKGQRLYELELLSTGGSRTFDTNAIIARYDSRILMTALADFIMLGSGSKTGSYALSSDKTEMFSDALGAWLDSIAATLNRHAVRPLLLINGFKGNAQVAHDDVEPTDIKDLGEYVKNLVAGGAPMFPDDDLEDYLRERAGLPKRAVPSADIADFNATALGGKATPAQQAKAKDGGTG